MSQHPAREQGAPARPELRNAFDLFTGLATGIVLLDAAGAVLSVNPVAAQRLTRPATEVLGLDLFREVMPELEKEGLGARYREGMGRAEGVSLEWEGPPRPGAAPERVWLGIRSARFNGSNWGVMVVEDRSALAEEEERRKRAERLAGVGELAAGVAHEVNNPLASIKSFAQLLAREATSSEQQRALEIIVDESARIARVVENLISFARQQGVSGREPVNLSEVASQVLDMQKYALDTAGIEVRLDLDRSLSPVMGEAGALHQVVLNLVTNAGEALASKPGPRLLIVRTRESSEGVLLSVVDNGPGIPRAILPHIFDGVADVSGSGLGLGISATIVRDHGGQIMAESEEGRGAAFFVRLPRSGVAAPSEAVRAAGGAPAPPPARKAPAAAEPHPAPARSLRVLVADDEPTLRLAISLFLGRRGHEVVQAADAREALQLAQEQDFDVALVDARMPGDGLRLLEKLENMPALQGRTALMTGDLGRARTHQGIATGRPYLVKPFDLMEAVNLIEKLGH